MEEKSCTTCKVKCKFAIVDGYSVCDLWSDDIEADSIIYSEDEAEKYLGFSLK